MVWAEISRDGRTDLLVVPGLSAQLYFDLVLEDHVISVAYGIGSNFVFMQVHANHRLVTTESWSKPHRTFWELLRQTCS